MCYILTPRPGLKMLFQGDTPGGSDTFQRPVIERDRVGGLRLMIWDNVKVSLCHYSHAPEESNLWTAWVISAWWRLNIRFKDPVGDRVGVELLFNSVEFGSQSSCQQTPRGLETRCGRERHTRPRATSETPDAVASRLPDSRDQMW